MRKNRKFAKVQGCFCATLLLEQQRLESLNDECLCCFFDEMFSSALGLLMASSSSLSMCVLKVLNENERLERLLKEKEVQISQSESKAKELSLKAEEFEELFNVQLSSVKALQADLQVASSENKSLVKEMEMLNQMFNTMERQYVTTVQTSANQQSVISIL